MSRKAMSELKDMLCRELDEISEKGEINVGDLETIHKLTSSIKNIYKIEMFEENSYYSNGRSYDGGNSYDDYSGRHYVRGHYSRDGYSRDGYSRDDYSRTGGDLKRELREMLERGGMSQGERAAITKLLDHM